MRVKRSPFIINGVVFVILLLCVLFSHIKIFSYLSLGVYCVYWIYLFHFNKTYFVKYLAFIFAAVGTVVGASVVELFPEQYLSELRCQSHFAGSLPLLIFSYWIFLNVLELMEYRYEKNIIGLQIDALGKRQYTKIINGFAVVSCIMLIVLFGYLVTHTLPASLLEIDRFKFALSYKMPWIISKIKEYSYLLLIFPLLALIYANRFIASIAILFYCISNFWVGEKFGAFFSLMCILLIVIYNKILSVNQRKLKKILTATATSLLLLIIVAAGIMSSLTGLNPYDYFTQRTAQQGQLWWKTYDLCNGEIHPAEFVNEINAFFEGDKPINDNVGAENGIYKIMYFCAPESVVSNKLIGGSRYTQADYAVVYYYFGSLGVIMYSILMGLIISGIVNSFIHALQKKEYIKAMIYCRFFMLIRTSFSMFTFGAFSGLISILSYVYLTVTHGRRLRLGFHKIMKSQVENGEINVRQ